MLRHSIRVTLLAVALLVSAVPGALHAADFPTKPITAIVTVAPGGSNDIQTRAFASVAEKLLKQPVVVINKPAASGMLGLLQGAEAAPDGYTLTTSSMSELCMLEWEKANNRKPEASLQDFTYIAGFTVAPLIIGVPANSPFQSLDDLIKEAKAKPGQLAYASGGLYRIAHINTEMFAQAFGLKFRHVPYSGGGPSVTAVVGGHEDFAAMTPSSSVPLFKAGKLRALALLGDRRLRSLPNVATVKELLGQDLGLPQIVGLGVPKKTPKPIVDTLRAVAKQVTEDRAFITAIESQGDEVHYVDGDEFTGIIDKASQRVEKVLKKMAEEKK